MQGALVVTLAMLLRLINCSFYYYCCHYYYYFIWLKRRFVAYSMLMMLTKNLTCTVIDVIALIFVVAHA